MKMSLQNKTKQKKAKPIFSLYQIVMLFH